MSDQVKNISFKASLDMQEANKQIADLQQKLRAISKDTDWSSRAKSAYGADSPMSKQAEKVFQEQQTGRVKSIREETDNLTKQLAVKQKDYDASKNSSRQTTDSLERQKKLTEEIFNIHKQIVMYKETENKLTSQNSSGAGGNYAGGGGTLPSGFGTTNVGTPTSTPSEGGGGGFSNIVKLIGAGAVGAMITKGIQGAANATAQTFFEYNQDKTRSEAKIAQATAQSSGLNDILSGKGAEFAFYANERQEAQSMAEEAYKGKRIREQGRHLALAAGGTVATGGLAAGVVTAPLAPLSALATTGAVATSMWNAEEGAGFRGYLKGGKKEEEAAKARYKQEYVQAESAKNLQALKEKEPIRKAAVEYFGANREKMLQAQQMSGVGDIGMRHILGAGGGQYTEDQKYGMMQGIAGAGGSSAQMRAGYQGLDLQRGYGIQNAAGIMGMLSSGLGGGQSAGDTTTKRILADAFSIGLDSSKFSRETEKFLQQSAQFVSDSGARTIAGQEAVAQIGANVSTGTSMKDIEAVGKARQDFDVSTGAGGGAMGQSLQFANMLGDSNFSEISPIIKNQIAAMNMSEIAGADENHPILSAAAAQKNITVEQLKSLILNPSGPKAFGASLTGPEAARQKQIGELRKKYGNLTDQENWQKRKKGLSGKALEEMEAAHKKAKIVLGEEASYIKSTTGITDSYEAIDIAQMKGDLAVGNKFEPTTAAPKRAETMQDTAQKAAAQAQIASLQAFTEHAEKYKQQSEIMLQASGEWITAVIKMNSAMASGDKEAQAKYQAQIDIIQNRMKKQSEVGGAKSTNVKTPSTH